MPTTDELLAFGRRIFDLFEVHSEEVAECPDGTLPAPIAEAVFAYLDQLPSIEDKLEALRAVVERLKSEGGLVGQEAARLSGRVSAIKAGESRVKGRIQELLEQHEAVTGERKIRGLRGTFWLQYTAPHVEAEGRPDKLPPRFQSIKVDFNKTAIKEALEAGEEVPGCSLQVSSFPRWR